MNREEAVKMLKSMKPWESIITDEAAIAVDMAISALQAQEAKNSNESSLTQNELDAVSSQERCAYCHTDNDGYITPLEKNCHALVWHSPIDGWILAVKYGAWRKDIPIRFCPMCGRRLKHG